MNHGIQFVLIIALSFAYMAYANPLETVSRSNAPELREVFDNLSKYHPQIILTRITRDASGAVEPLKTFEFNTDPARYFYPASTIKLPAAVLAAELISNHSSADSQPKLHDEYQLIGTDLETVYPKEEERRSNLARDIERIAVASDNMAFNRLYDLLSPDAMETRIVELTLNRPRISHRLAISLPRELNRTLMGFEFLSGDKSLNRRMRILAPHRAVEPTFIGIGYRSRGELIKKPFPVHTRNFITLRSLHEITLGLVLGAESTEVPQFRLTPDIRSFLLTQFSKLPRQSEEYAKLDPSLPDNYAKFLIYGDQNEVRIPDSIRIVNKIGQAYGFLTDTAYVTDSKSNAEFVLSATVFVNNNLIFNDNEYEYEQVGLPFLGALGRTVLEDFSR